MQEQKPQFEAFEFRGDAKEYFKIWIVNIALTLLTLGIYSAWAKVRTNRYIYGNTYLSNSNFEYNANPKRILLGRVIIVLFYGLFLLFGDYLGMYEVAIGLVILFLLLLPWLIRQAISFKLKSASYRNIPFRYLGSTKAFYLLGVLGILSIVSLPILIGFLSGHNKEVAAILGLVAFILLFVVIIPALYRRYKALVINNARYGNATFYFDAKTKDVVVVFIKMGILTFALTFLLGAVALLVAGIGSALVDEMPSNIKNNQFPEIAVSVIIVVVYLFVAGLYKGINDAYLSNFVRDHTRLEDAKFKGEIDPLKLGAISATNSIALLISLGLLYPWTKLRYLKYKIENTYIACNNYDQFTSSGYENLNTIGEETMDFFDIEIGI